jgi:hypothetical protein
MNMCFFQRHRKKSHYLLRFILLLLLTTFYYSKAKRRNIILSKTSGLQCSVWVEFKLRRLNIVEGLQLAGAKNTILKNRRVDYRKLLLFQPQSCFRCMHMMHNWKISVDIFKTDDKECRISENCGLELSSFIKIFRNSSLSKTGCSW